MSMLGSSAYLISNAEGSRYYWGISKTTIKTNKKVIIPTDVSQTVRAVLYVSSQVSMSLRTLPHPPSLLLSLHQEKL